MNRPKVLVLTSSYPKYKGDINGNFVYELVIRLKNDFDIYILAPTYLGSLSFEINEEIKIYRHKQFIFKNVELAYGSDILAKIKKNYLYILVIPFFLIFQFLSIIRIVKKERIQLIHAHWLIPQAFLAVLYKTFLNRNIKIITTIHGADINSFENFMGKVLKKIILNRIDELAVVSSAIKEKVIELGYKKEVYVYPMGVDTKLFSPYKKDETIRTKYNISGDFLLFVGGLIERKGIRPLIKAMPKIIKEFPDAKLVVVGEGNLKKEMIELANRISVLNNIHFTGIIPHDELPPYFATADLFILPSFSEGFGLVIAEALSSKTLTIASNLNAIHDIIIDNETGLYFEEITSNEFSRKIIYVLSNRNEYKEISNKGRRHIIKNFDWNIVKDNYYNILSKIIEL